MKEVRRKSTTLYLPNVALVQGTLMKNVAGTIIQTRFVVILFLSSLNIAKNNLPWTDHTKYM